MKTAFSAHNFLKTFQGLCLGFPKRPYIWKSIHMATRDEPLKDVVGGLLISVWPIFGIFYVFPVYAFNGPSRVAIWMDFQM